MNKHMILLSSLVALSSLPNILMGCTGIRLKSQEGTVYARTMFFPKDLDSRVLFVPRDYTFSGTLPCDEKGLTWKSKHAVIGANAAQVIGFVDGINERGLAGGLFMLANAEYQKMKPEDSDHAIAWHELLTWLLTTCESIEEVKQELPKIKVSDAFFEPWKVTVPVHAVLHDEMGASVIIKYIQGKLSILDNPWGAMANTEFFTEHVLQQDAQCPFLISSDEERFQCAQIISRGEPVYQTQQEAVSKALVLLGSTFNQWPLQWSSVCDIKNKRYYIFTDDKYQILDFKSCYHFRQPRSFPIEHSYERGPSYLSLSTVSATVLVAAATSLCVFKKCCGAAT